MAHRAHEERINAQSSLINDPVYKEGYERATELLHRCSTPDGFLAAPTDLYNYRRVWGRDGGIMGLAALCTADSELIRTARRTFETLAKYQGPHGEIPSNVDTTTNRISYGGTTGRVDADLWFVIGCGEYWRVTRDDDFLEEIMPALEKVRFLLGAWEYNNRGLIFVPLTGDWADEYIHHGYVLYDELLYLQAQRIFCAFHRHVYGSVNHEMQDRMHRLRHLIQSNYWLQDGQNTVSRDIYHEVLFEKSRQLRERACPYWMSFFSPQGYGYRFDTLANVLASLLGVANEDQCRCVDEHIESEVSVRDVDLLAAFHPIIKPEDEDWDDLQMTFSYAFKNEPYEYQNGGLWPMVTGFYVADLARRGRMELAARYLKGIHRANSLTQQDTPWSFPEFLNGRTYEPGGTMFQGWSAAAAIIGHHAIQGNEIFHFS